MSAYCRISALLVLALCSASMFHHASAEATNKLANIKETLSTDKRISNKADANPQATEIIFTDNFEAKSASFGDGGEFAFEAYAKSIKSANVIGTAGSDMFGDQTNWYTGSTSFTHVDIDVPGNSGLPVRLVRKLKGNISADDGYTLGDWDLHIPHLSGLYSKKYGWQVEELGKTNGSFFGGSNQRCSIVSGPPTVEGIGAPERGIVAGEEYWNGNSLVLPLAGNHNILAATTTSGQKPTDGKTYPWKSANHWHFSCIPIANQSDGEGFEGLAPDGTRYRFDWLVTYHKLPYSRMFGDFTAPYRTQKGIKPKANVNKVISVARNEVRLMVTQITDRFGNWVKYDYDPVNPKRIKRIYSNDGRSINLAYNAQGRIESAKAHGKTWQYNYKTNPNKSVNLNKVLLPSNNSENQQYWEFDTKDWNREISYSTDQPAVILGALRCINPGSVNPDIKKATIRHPSGATGYFEAKPQRHHRSGVQKICSNPNPANADTPHNAIYPVTYDTMSLTKKVITGVGIQPQEWTITYDGGKPTWADECRAQGASCNTTKSTNITEPSGFRRLTFGNKFRDQEGLLLKEEVGNTATDILQTTKYTYNTRRSSQPWPTPLGHNFNQKSSGADDAYLRPLHTKTTKQQEFDFTYQADNWNQFGDPKASRTNGVRGYQAFTHEYQHDFSKWVIRKNKKQTMTQSVGGVMSETIYDPATMLPKEQYAFGLLKAKNTWNTDGTLASTSDALNRTTQYSNYHRGTPQNVTYPDGTSISATVDDHGQITSVTNELDKMTQYTYDQQGRITQISPPGDFLSTQIQYTQLSETEHGLSSNHWKQTRTHGKNKAETYFDALYRPVLSVSISTDQDNPSEPIFTRKAFDTSGREIFTSYPQHSLTQTTTGLHTHYDALNRVTKTEQDSELGKLATVIAYPNKDDSQKFTKQITNPRGHTTIYAYQAFGTPSYDKPVEVTHPDANQTLINRDNMGRVTQLTQSGLNRYIQYDDHQRVCRVRDEASGTTWFKYNSASELIWQGHNQFGFNTACIDENAPATPDVTFNYDNRGRITHADYANGTDDKTYTYFDDGALKTLASGNSTWAYEYNSLGQPTKQTLTHAGQTWQIKDAYNTAGHHEERTLPSGLTIRHKLNAFGLPTRIDLDTEIGSIATSIAYHPNQSVKFFLYGNTTIHQTSINTRQLPSSINEAGFIGYAQKSLSYDGRVLDYSFTWDANANLTELIDAVGQNSSSNQYNSRDFLTTSILPDQGSNITYDYDKADNIKQINVNDEQHRYGYTSNQQLHALDIGNHTQNRYTYDTRGNTLTRRNASANELYTHTYDVQNRMLSSVYGSNTETYAYDGHNRRIDTVTNGQHRYSIYDLSGQLVMTHDVAARKCIEYIHLGKRLIAESQTTDCSKDGPITYQHLNHLGTPVQTSDEYNRSTPQEAEALMPYGLPYSGNHVQGIGFTGHITDSGSKLSYMQQRYYDPLMRRFLSVDPVTPSTYDGSNLNRYWYANNNPYKYTDPDGRWAHIAIGAVAGGLINGGVEAYVQFKTGTFSAKNLLIETGKGAGVGAATAAAPASAGVAVGGLKVGSRLSKVASVARATGQAGAAGSVGELGAQAAKGQELDAQKAVVAGVSNATGLTIGKVMHAPAKAMSSGTIPGNPGLPVKSLSGRVFNVGQTPAIQYTDEVLMQSLQDISGEVTSSAIQEVHKKNFEKEIQ